MENNLKEYQDYQKVFCEKIEMIVQTYNTKAAFTYLRDTKDEVITFNQVKKYLQNRKKDFEDIGLLVGDRVAIIAPHSPYNILTSFALSYFGTTVVLIDTSLPIEEQEKLLSFSDVRAIFTTEEIYGHINIHLYVNIPFFDVNNKNQLVPFNKSVKDCILVPATNNPKLDVIAILFSSGTTDQMKGVEIKYSSILYAYKYMVEYTNLNETAKFLNVLPSNHIAGYSSAISCFLSGAEQGFLTDVGATSLSQGFLRYNPTNFIMIPKVYEIIMNKIQSEIEKKPVAIRMYAKIVMGISHFVRKYTGLKLRFLTRPIWSKALGSNMKICGCGTASCSYNIIKFYLDLGIDFVNVYGSTETGFPITAVNCNDRYPQNGAGKVNQFPEIKIHIISPDKKGVGEIRVKTPLIMNGYFKNEKLTNEAFDEEGFFKTGDVGYVDKDGNLNITGRIKESIVLRTGKKVSPVDVDEYYSSRVSGIEFASRGIANEKESYDEIYLFVENKSYSAAEIENIQNELNSISKQAPSMYKLEGIYFIPHIPKTTVGKVKRFYLEIPKEQKTVTEIEKNIDGVLEQKSHEEILFEVINHILDSKVNKTYGRKEKLEQDIGMDSLNVFEMCVVLQERTGVSIEGNLHKNITVGDVLDLLRERGISGHKNVIEDINKYPLKKTKRIKKNFNLFKHISNHLWKIEVYGKEGLDFSQQYIFCPNHESHFDGLWIMSCLPDQVQEKICSMAADYLFEKRRYRFGVEIMGGIPVHRSGNTTLAMKRIYDCLTQEGDSLLIHPEGTRTRNGKLGEFKLGAARLAKQTNIKIVPVHIEGAREIFPPDRKLPRLSRENGQKRRLVIRFGCPIEPEDKSEQQITREIKQSIEGM